MAIRRLKRTLYKQKCYIAFGHGFQGNAEDLARHIGCTVNSAKRYMSEWNVMNKDQRQLALRKAIKDIKFMEQTQVKSDTDGREFLETPPERPKPKPAAMDGLRTPYSVQKQNRSRSLISHY